MDTNFHYCANFTTRKVINYCGTIDIGDKCWLANSVTVMKDTRLPNHTIVASHSLVNKDFCYLKPGSIIGGVPAKFITGNVFRIRNHELETEVMDYFINHPEEHSYALPDWVTPDNI